MYRFRAGCDTAPEAHTTRLSQHIQSGVLESNVAAFSLMHCQVDYLTPFLQHVPDVRNVSAADAQRARDACLKALKDRLLVRIIFYFIHNLSRSFHRQAILLDGCCTSCVQGVVCVPSIHGTDERTSEHIGNPPIL